MNRYVKKFLIFTITSLFIFLLYWIYYPALGRISLSKGIELKEKKSKDSTFIQKGYVFEEDTWAEFKIPVRASILKITSNSMFYYGASLKSYSYEIDYEILDNNGTALISNTYFLEGKASLYKEKHSNRILSDPFLIDGSQYLTKDKDILVPLPLLNNPSVLKIKWRSSSPMTKSIIVRASGFVLNLSGKSEDNQWIMMSDEKKQILASNSLFFSGDMKKEEIKNIMSKKWKTLSLDPKNGKLGLVCRIGMVPLFNLRPFKVPAKKSDMELTQAPKKIKSEMFKLYLQSAGGVFKQPSMEELKTAQKFFEELFNLKDVSSEMIKAFNELGFEVKQINRKYNKYIIIYEKENRKEGKGFYIFCRNSNIKYCALEIPHRFFDEKTGVIGFKMLGTGYFSACAWNTVHRYQTPNDMPGSSDMSHNKHSFFHAFTKAFLTSSANNKLMLELHGFDEVKHKLDEDPFVIISDGAETPSNQTFTFWENLNNKTEVTIKLPSDDIKLEELSAQNNIAAKAFSRSNDGKMFIHFEMNSAIRTLLLENKKFLKKFSLLINEAAKDK